MQPIKMGYVGLGRMGLPMVTGLSKKTEVVAFDADPKRRSEAKELGIQTVENICDLPSHLTCPRVIWLMVPMGEPVDQVIDALLPALQKGDVLVDGGNADYRDSNRRRSKLYTVGIGFVGAGTSGGTAGALQGPPMSVDCSLDDYKKILPVLNLLGGNHAHFEDAGKGHLAKTLHNAIEYGMMQSLAEGVALHVKHGFTEDEVLRIFETWSRGSIIESRLINCLIQAIQNHPLAEPQQMKRSETLGIVRGVLRTDCRTPVIEKSACLRDVPDEQDPVASTVLALLRLSFGGHALHEKS
jgi:6-phosphogluconate dehydrogenase